ncbi:hypothetical protein [Actinomadura livida]|uniref:Uncharacterized protein n=1 Tax=Actinomadura livida TaxID=79909 RepID=A0A7W7MW14_9ACTN|nr:MULTISPECIES: hypothetical protein [Actinomadura]MBB4772357.1 hypothetical protein [Actinomadura catellatispora]GGU23535.1 hypothetical protein GCM10010208_55780 [Actinomadura livida]
MTDAAWFSEPFRPEGGSVAEGIRKQLGRPDLDLLAILVRESAQNSWDARLADRGGTVDYRIDLQVVGPAQRTNWKEILSKGAPLATHLPIRETLNRSIIRLMSISDRGTSGLGGPTRADKAVTTNLDFVSFVRNIGAPRDRALGGGTYGFGKGIFYRVSKPGTILLHTRCRVGDRLETRLMGCALWQNYIAEDATGERPYTGRHWWGDVSGDVVEPLTGDAADMMAKRLGLEPFAPDETGTTVIMLDPSLDDREPTVAADYLAETIAWHLWPKMLDGAGGAPAMRFSVTCDGIEHPVPDPRETRPLNLFVAAYEGMKGPQRKRLKCHRPKKDLGDLGLVKRVVPPFEATAASRMVGIENLVHHVCLMRPAELVVTYRPGPKPPSEFQSYAGVFRGVEEMDEVYAAAEPPTHDAWNPQSLEYPASTFVNTTFRRINEELNGLLELGGNVRPGAAKIALGAASVRFASLLGGAWGTGGASDYGKPGDTRTPPTDFRTGSGDIKPTGPSVGGDAEDGLGVLVPPERMPGTGGGDAVAGGDRGPGAGDSGTGTSDFGRMGRDAPDARAGAGPVRRPRVEYVSEPYFDERSGTPVLIQEFRLPVPGAQRVRIDLAVAITGAGRETEPPIGAAMPGLVGWEDTTGNLFGTPKYVIEGGDGTIWRAVVRPAPDTMTEIEVLVEAVNR